MKQTNKMVIYQVFPSWFGNMKSSLVKNGRKVETGVGKFSAFTPVALSKIKELGTTHVWYPGVIEHATNTDYTAYQIRKDHAAVVKGNAGSPYAITGCHGKVTGKDERSGRDRRKHHGNLRSDQSSGIERFH